MHITHSLLALGLCAALSAQSSRIVAYPQDTTTFSSGNIVPLGSFGPTSNFEEGRWQQLIPATHLPTTQGLVFGMSFICQTLTGTMTYPSLRITMSHTTATTLGTTFASNLPTPVLVLNATNLPVNWVSRGWVQINFTTPFAYNGTDNIVFDIQKVVTPIASGIATMETDGNPGRSDLPPTRYAFGGVGSGASNATTASFSVIPLQVRLAWQRTPSLFLKSDRLLSGSTNVFAITGSIDVGLDAGTGAQWVAFLDAGFTTPYTVPGLLGFGRVLPTVVFPVRTVTTAPDSFNLPIPGLTGLVGAQFAMQALAIDPTLGSNVFFTNAADFIVRTN